MCEYCEKEIYIKVPKVMKSLIAPATNTGVLIDELEDILGISLVKLQNLYCPMCGRNLREDK